LRLNAETKREFIQFLINSDANIQAENANKETPAQLALKTNDLVVCNMFISAGANYDSETLPTPESHQEFFKAIKCDDLDRVKKAVKSTDLDPKTVEKDGLTPLQYALEHTEISLKEGVSKELFNFLVNECTAPAQFNVRTLNRETLLHLVYKGGRHKGKQHEFVETLLGKGTQHNEQDMGTLLGAFSEITFIII